VAAAHWQDSICRLLIANRADVNAREWIRNYTPLSLACRKSIKPEDDNDVVYNALKDPINVIRLLLENGADVCTSTEADIDMTMMTMTLDKHSVRRLRRDITPALAYLFRAYERTITCDGLLAVSELNQHVAFAINASGASADGQCRPNRSNMRSFDRGLLSRRDLRIFQLYWLYGLADATQNERENAFLHDFCGRYTGDFHYQLPVEENGRRETASPLQLALKSRFAMATFLGILSGTQTNLTEFVRKECTMPWCTHTPETLEHFFSLYPRMCAKLVPPLNQWCHQCSNSFDIEASRFWRNLVKRLESGRSVRVRQQDPSHSVCCGAERFRFGGRHDRSPIKQQQYTLRFIYPFIERESCGESSQTSALTD
jgi:hypothetical protein